MKRREFVKGLGAATVAGFIAPKGFAQTKASQIPAGPPEDARPWNTVEISIQINNDDPAAAELWLPTPLAETSYQKLLRTSWTGNFAHAETLRDPVYGASSFHASWEKGKKKELALTHVVQLRDREDVESEGFPSKDLYLMPTAHIQTDGIVKTTAEKIVGLTKDPDRKAKLIYDWIVANTFRDPKTRGCGTGDVKSLLSSNSVGGKCADLSSLFAGLCRAAGVPAREVFGLRVRPSKVSKSIGKEGDVSKAQHCRAEYYSSNKRGWVPVDPADVRKVILEEKLTEKDPHVQEVAHKLFGFWEMNWVAYNSARDFSLAPAGPEKLNYLMYPLLVSSAGEIDGREPDKFKYSIAAKALNA